MLSYTGMVIAVIGIGFLFDGKRWGLGLLMIAAGILMAAYTVE